MKTTLRSILLACAAGTMAIPALAQEAGQAEAEIQTQAVETQVEAAVEVPAPVAFVPSVRATELPARTEIILSLNEQLSSRTHDDGDTFGMTVVQDVLQDGHVVIPRGTRAVGQVTWQTGTGAFGKSGKMEIAFRYLDLNGRRIPLDGMHRQEGEGNTAATIGAVLGAGVVGGLLVRGRRALLQEGREFSARIVDPIPVELVGEGAPALIAASYTPSAPSTELGEYRPDRERNRNNRRSGNSSRGSR